MPTVLSSGEPFDCRFGEGAGAALRVASPVLAGETSETLFTGFRAVGTAGGFRLYEAGDMLAGAQVVCAGERIGAQTEEIYRALIGAVASRGMQIARVWNYVPDINADCAEGLETYRAFCRGRSLAFERAGWKGAPPAASAVGGAAGELAVIFAATKSAPVSVENPEQVPAFEYPKEYGPRSPSFSRAMRVEAGGKRWVFVSGTAAIKGHVSQATGDLAGQIACTLDNLRIISAECGLGPALGAGEAGERHFKIYLRKPDDLAAARALLEGTLLLAGDRVTWLQADICRADLLIEIEATVVA